MGPLRIPSRGGHSVAPPPWVVATGSLLLVTGLVVLLAFAPLLRDPGAPACDGESHAAGFRHSDQLQKDKVWHRQRILEEEMEGGNILDSGVNFMRDHFNWVDPSGMRHEAAYLGYKSPAPEEEMDRWYHTITPKNSSDDTYFAVSGTSFGYLGIQQVRDTPYFQGKVVFSIWDKGGEADEESGDQAELVECGDQAVCKRFGGEGTGTHSHINFWDWKIMHAYSFMTRAFDSGNGTVRYEGYLYAPEYGGWVLCAKIKVRRGEQPWHIRGMYSFVEHWSPRDYGDARWARLGPSFARFGNGTDANGTGWQQIRTATFTHTWELDKADVNANVTDGGTKWGLGVGGNVSVGEQNAELTVDECSDLPEALLEFEALELNGTLPGGCEGGTCWQRRIIAFFREAHSSSMIARALLFEVVTLLAVFLSFYCSGCCCSCCYSASWQQRSADGYDAVKEQEAQSRQSSNSMLICCRSAR